MQKWGGWIFSGCLLFVLSGCGGCFDRFAEGDDLMRYEAVGTPEFARQCHGVGLASATARPFERVDVDLAVYDFSEAGPQRVEDLFAVGIRFSEEGEEYFQFVHFDEEAETHYFHAPPHSSGTSGGEMWLRFTDGEMDCAEEVELSISSIGPSPGALEEALTLAAQVSRATLDFYGYDAEELLQRPEEEIPLLLLPLVSHIWTIDHPDNEHALVRTINERRGPFAVEEAVFEELDAFFAVSGMISALQGSLETLAELKAEAPDFELRFRQAQPLISGLVIDQQRQALCSSILNLVGEVEINTARELSQLMLAARTASQMADEVGVANAWVTMAGSGAGNFGAALGVVLAADQISRMAHARLLPTQLYGATAEYDDQFEEDSTEMKRWTNFRISAASLGWDATQTILEALMSAGNNLAPGNTGAAVTVFDKLSGLETISGVAGLNYMRDTTAYQAIYDLFENRTDCQLETGPWEDIPVSLATPVSFEISHRFAVAHRRRQGPICWPNDQLTIPLDRYEARATGTGLLRVNLPPASYPPDTNRASSRWEAPVFVRPINVVFRQGNTVGAPGSTVEVVAEIQNAVDTRGSWSVEPASAEILEFSRDGDVHRATIRLPEDVEDFPIFVTLESDSTSGLRHRSCDPAPRSSTAVIRFEESIEISPKIYCIAQGESLQFDARIFSPVQDPQVIWETSGGSIDSSGLFQGTDDGEFLVSATLPDSQRTASARVRVGLCECFYHLSLRGSLHADYGEFGYVVSEYLGEEMFLMRFGRDETGTHTNFFVPEVIGLEGMPFSALAGGTVKMGNLPNVASLPPELRRMELWFDPEATVIIVDHWSERDYIQGRILGFSEGGVLPRMVDGQERLLQMELSTVMMELEFMTPLFNPLRNPLGNFSHSCPGSGLDLGAF